MSIVMYVLFYFSHPLYSHRYRRASCHCERGFYRSPQAVHRDCSRLTRFPRSPHVHLRRAHFLRSVSAFPTSVLFCVRSNGVSTDADVALSVLRARQPWQAFGAYEACARSKRSERGHSFFPDEVTVEEATLRRSDLLRRRFMMSSAVISFRVVLSGIHRLNRVHDASILIGKTFQKPKDKVLVGKVTAGPDKYFLLRL
jgi:hypothetical protein